MSAALRGTREAFGQSCPRAEQEKGTRRCTLEVQLFASEACRNRRALRRSRRLVAIPSSLLECRLRFLDGTLSFKASPRCSDFGHRCVRVCYSGDQLSGFGSLAVRRPTHQAFQRSCRSVSRKYLAEDSLRVGSLRCAGDPHQLKGQPCRRQLLNLCER